VTINHLSPNRYLRHFKEKEDSKTLETHAKFNQFETKIKDSVLLLDNKPVHMKELTQDDIIKLMASKNSYEMIGLQGKKLASSKNSALSMSANRHKSAF